MYSDFKAAVRALIQRPGYTGVIVVTLAVIIGCNTAMFTMLNAVLLRPIGYVDPDRLVMLWENNRAAGQEQSNVSGPAFKDWRERTRAFQAMAAFRYAGHTLSIPDGEPQRIVSLEVSPSLFPAVGVNPAMGKGFSDDDEKVGGPAVAIVSYGAWKTRFGGNPRIIDSTIALDGRAVTVVGVMPQGFQFPPADTKAEVWVPLRLGESTPMARAHRLYQVIGRLKPGVEVTQASEDMTRIADELGRDYPESHKGWGVTLVPAHEQLVGDFRTMVWMLFAAVTLVLLIGCVNVANLVLARSAESTREFAIRSAFGARGFALLRLSLIEGFLLSAAGGVAGVLVAGWGVELLRQLVPARVPRADQIGIDLTVLGFTAGVSVLAGLVFGLVPAIRTMRPNLSETLQGSVRGTSIGRATRRLSDVLVACEVALAVILLIGAGLMVSTLLNLMDTKPGFRKTNVVSAVLTLSGRRYAGKEPQRIFFMDLIDRMKTVPGVQSAGAVSALPMSAVGTDFSLPFTMPGLQIPPNERPRAKTRVVLPGYFEAMGIPLIRGRLLDKFDEAPGHAFGLINETMARQYFSEIDPIGQKLGVPMAGTLEIVGVVGDVRHDSLQSNAGPELFIPFELFGLSTMHVVVHTTSDTQSTIEAFKRKVLEMDAQQPITEASSIERLLSLSIAQPRFNMAMLIALGACAVVLAAVGIYAVVSYAVTRRTMEIGIRMALGAGREQTLRMVVSEALRVVAIGGVIGIIGAFALVRFITGLLFEVRPTNLPTYAVSMLIVLIIGLIAAVIPAIRASRVDPAIALRDHAT
jgi:putative ABC transport system permease protein